MKLSEIKFEIPEDIISALNTNTEKFTSEIRLLTAIQLFKEHKLSLGKSTQLVGISKEKFILYLDQYKVPLINYPAEELENELKELKK